MHGWRVACRGWLQVKDARPLLEDAEAERMFPPETLTKEAITATEQDGIVFIDEVRGPAAASARRCARRAAAPLPGCHARRARWLKCLLAR